MKCPMYNSNNTTELRKNENGIKKYKCNNCGYNFAEKGEGIIMFDL